MKGDPKLPGIAREITGRLVKIEGVDPPKGKGKKNAERTRDVEPKLILGNRYRDARPRGTQGLRHQGHTG